MAEITALFPYITINYLNLLVKLKTFTLKIDKSDHLE